MVNKNWEPNGSHYCMDKSISNCYNAKSAPAPPPILCKRRGSYTRYQNRRRIVSMVVRSVSRLFISYVMLLSPLIGRHVSH